MRKDKKVDSNKEQPFTLLDKNLQVINIGVKSFYDSLKEQKVKVVQVTWRPPAGGDTHLMDLLEKMG